MQTVFVIAEFGPLTAFAFIVTVVAVAYFRFTDPGEVLSWWARLINTLYQRATKQARLNPDYFAKRIGKSVEDYYQAANYAGNGYDEELNEFGIQLDRDYSKTSIYFKGGFIGKVENKYLVTNLTSIDFQLSDRFERYQWVLKPILTCEKCIAGQLAVWLYLLTFPFDLLAWLYVISLASYLATWLINRLNA